MTPVTSDGPLLRTPSGTVRGSWRAEAGKPPVAVFRAVPVAEPHTPGPAAFAAPEPVAPWSGVLDLPDVAPSRRDLHQTHTVTVYAPADATDPADPAPAAPYPVIAWVHGGRFETGHADDPWYDGTALARQGCVVVALNYRRKFEGFLPLDGDGADTGTTTFRGVDDLLLGLRWIRECIGGAGGVGGDPDRVTLAGQSAGAALAAWLLTDGRSAGLVHRAVLMSPGAPRRGWTQRRLTTRLALRIVRRPLTAEGLGGLSPARLSAAYRRFAALHATDCAVGVHPLEVGNLRPVPVLVGTMHDEFVRFPLVRQLDAGLRRVLGRLGLPPLVDAWLLAPAMLLLGVPPASLPAWCRYVARTSPVRPLGRTVGDRVIRRWASAFAEALAARDAPVWAYDFRAGPGGEAQHCAELPLLFDTLRAPGVDPREVEEFCGPDAAGRLGRPGGTGEQFRGTVVGFAHGTDPDWPQFRPPDRAARIFGMSGGTGPAPVVRDPWNAVRRLLGPLY